MDVLAFITDTHFGCDTTGFQQQPRRPDLMPAVVDGLSVLLHSHGCQALLHGGDMVDTGGAEEIATATRALSSLEIEVMACLGNHDLGLPSSRQDWESRRGGLHLADGIIKTQHADIIALNTQWIRDGVMDYYWEHRSDCREAVADEQLDWLDKHLAEGDVNRPAILLIHVALDGLPPEFTGHEMVIHRPTPAYTAPICEVLNRHPRVKLVLSGHNHVNYAVKENGRIHLSSTSLIEPPFEMRLIRINERSLEIETLPVITMPEDTQYLQEAAWVNGRPQDRFLDLRW